MRRLDDAISWLRPGAAFEMLIVRQQRILTLRVPERAAVARTDAAPRSLKLAAAPNAATHKRRVAWLGQ